MTIQVLTATQSKAVLLACLKDAPASVQFVDPSVFQPRNGGDPFTGADIQPGEKFPVVMDHPKRTRFAQVVRTADGWKVL